MNLLLTFLVLCAAAGLAATTRTRSARIAQMAQRNGCRFEHEKDSVTTELTAGRLEFFTFFFHQYQNVCTCTDDMAFIRVADDQIYTDDDPKTKPVCITIFTAELKKRRFPALKVSPLSSPYSSSQYTQMKTNIPEIDKRYRIHAPAQESGLLLTPFLTGLLKAHPDIYLELNDSALIYHEHAQIPMAEFQAFRFRTMQLLKEVETVILKLDQAEQTNPASSLVPAENAAAQRAEAMMKALCSVQKSDKTSSPSGWRGMWVIVLLAAVLGLSMLSWFALNNWVAH